jgi:PPOX class probable FMN-dependent enzyme
MSDAAEVGDTTYQLGDEAALRERYRPPAQVVLEKSRPRIDPEAAKFVAASPLMVLATSSASGADASPRGGPPGFVQVLDDGHLAFGDLSGNNRLDSYANLVERPEVGILFLVPGMEETLRVNGRARVTTDPSVLECTAIDGVHPKVAVVVDVAECYIHCAKALRRSGVWDPSTWMSVDQRPSAARVFTDQFQLDVDPAVIEADLEAGYQATLWREGGL